jgi:hypothetical protein
MSGLPDFSWYNIPEREKIYQMTINYTKYTKVRKVDQMDITSSIASSKIYPHWDFWFDNIPFGNPAVFKVKLF